MSEIQIGHWTKLGSTIRDARTRRKWSQHELAAHAQVSRSWLAKMEADTGAPNSGRCCDSLQPST